MRIEFAQKAIISSGEKYLLVRKGLNDPRHPGKWEFPGGRIKPGENPDEGIRREVREETGLDIIPGRPLSMWSWQVGGRQIVAVTRLCVIEGGVISLSGQEGDDYIDAICWYTREEISNLDLIPNSIQSTREAFDALRD